jgi:hypothetical protein
MEKFAEYLRNTITDKMTLKEIVDIFENACQLMNEDDMILFETGTYNFTGEELFYFSLVKQVPAEDDEYYQLHIDILYKPNAENRKFHSAVWDDGLEENIFDYIRNSEAFNYAKKNNYLKIDIYADET